MNAEQIRAQRELCWQCLHDAIGVRPDLVPPAQRSRFVVSGVDAAGVAQFTVWVCGGHLPDAQHAAGSFPELILAVDRIA